jgi:prepilin-type N-terminal cleavage/methylation domain-containing protein
VIRRRLRGTFRGERGYSLIELVVVMAILGVVMAGLTTVFVSGGTAELSMNRRFQAQEQARLALDRIRGDIHCASAASTATINGYPSLKLNTTGCNAARPYIYWCVVSVSASPVRYKLWRTTSTSSTPTASTCTASDTSRSLVADYLTASSAFTTAAAPLNGLHVVGVDFRVSVNPTTTKDVYDLKDSIVARNSTRCAVASCAASWPT